MSFCKIAFTSWSSVGRLTTLSKKHKALGNPLKPILKGMSCLEDGKSIANSDIYAYSQFSYKALPINLLTREGFMQKNMELQLTTQNCEISEGLRFQMNEQIHLELNQFPDHSKIELTISQLDENHWSFDLSMRYARGHVATNVQGASLDEAIMMGIAAFRNDLRIHTYQAAVETFHFDRAAEYDYYTEISNKSTPLINRKLSVLILEDDPAAALVLKTTLKAHGCDVDHCDLPDNALEALSKKRYNLLVLDWNLPYMKGNQFLTAADSLLKTADLYGRPVRQTPVVICTSLPIEDIHLPLVTHFYFCNHWHKGLPFSSVLSSIDEVTQKISVRNQILA